MHKLEPYVGLGSSLLLGGLALDQAFNDGLGWAITFVALSLLWAMRVFWSMIHFIDITMESECDQHETY